MESLRSLRVGKGLSQEDVANAIGVTRVSVARYESRTRTPSPRVVAKLASFFGLEIKDAWQMFYGETATKEA